MKEIGLKLIILMLCLVSNASIAVSQRKALTTEDYLSWQSITNNWEISDDGTYVVYNIANKPVGGNTTVFRAVDGSCMKEVEGGRAITITPKNEAVYLVHDSLKVLNLLKKTVKTISSNVNGIEITENKKWILYYSVSNNEANVLNTATGKNFNFKNYASAKLSPNGRYMVIERNVVQDSCKIHMLTSFFIGGDVPIERAELRLEDNSEFRNIAFDNENKIIAFTNLHKVKNEKDFTTLELFNIDNGKHDVLIDERSIEKKYSMSIEIEMQQMEFDRSSNKLFLKLRKNRKVWNKHEELASVDIWSYNDEFLNSDPPIIKSIYQGVVNIGRMDSLLILESESDYLLKLSEKPNSKIGKYALRVNYRYLNEYWWNQKFRSSVQLVSTDNGSSIDIIEASNHLITNVLLSPDERTVIWYDSFQKMYFKYDIKNRVTAPIGAMIPYPLFDQDEESLGKQMPYGIAGWVDDGRYLLLYDKYDIWMLNLHDDVAPLMISKFYGRQHNFILSIAEKNKENSYKINSSILLAAFDVSTKANGFIRTKLNEKFPITAGMMLPYSMCIPRTFPYIKGLTQRAGGISAGVPKKAKNKEVFLLMRMKADVSPNLVITKDFLRFTEISNIFPEQGFNWLNADLIEWRTVDDKLHQGILYRPSNFDSSKKYPVIFNYYEQKSDGLHSFLEPGLSKAEINIPQYVSNGYLIFVPDIKIRKGQVGASIIETITSAVHYLSKFSWIDTERLGLQGHSFGGFETNYIITHCNLFAAACEGAGASNLTSSYGQIAKITCDAHGNSRQSGYEIGQSPMGGTLWEKPQVYLNNSPVFNVGDVSTPLLIWHCKNDGAVPFEQAIEMYLALRRAEKKVWLLQYDGDEHATNGVNSIDLDIRMRQFFDFYLKRERAPLWMTSGIEPHLKQVESRLGYDSNGVFP